MATEEENAGQSPLPQSDPEKKPFTPENLDRSLIAIPLLRILEGDKDGSAYHHVIIDLNLEYHRGKDAAKALVEDLLEQVEPYGLDRLKSELTENYLFARLTSADVRRFAQLVHEAAPQGMSLHVGRPVHRIWLDQKLNKLTNASIAIVKGIAARNAFAALGDGIVWAVADSGVDATHPHFATHQTLDLHPPLRHRDLTKAHPDEETSAAAALTDVRGHGTHVAGIIAGELVQSIGVAPPAAFAAAGAAGAEAPKQVRIRATTRRRTEDGTPVAEVVPNIERMSGVAPRTKILSLKVLADDGSGLSSNLIAAIAYVQKLNGYGRRLRIHGLNMSVGYDFDPEWFACGQSPLCVEVNRLVKSGVCVVVAAGNTGYGWVQLTDDTARQAGIDLTINDPGNADLAITVGSTHRDMPHIYGVSYFSSKGPTGDGRLKPDLVAPGEKILSCRSAQAREEVTGEAIPNGEAGMAVGQYKEDSGTSMAAPHVSGAIAAFLSVRREFIGRPEEVKDIFLASATDLKRDRHFQGAGLLDLMRALQSV